MTDVRTVNCPAHVRWMLRRDMPDILRIEQESFENPWSESYFINALRNRNTIGMTAELLDEKIVGYMLYELHRDHLFLTNIAVDSERRFFGVGSTMQHKLFSKLSHERRRRIVTMVREENLGAQLFFQRLGYIATEVVKSPCDDSDCDGYKMEFYL